MKNRLKFDITTDLPNYGCEVFDVEKLPKFGKKFIKRKGINPLIVKKRKRGLTGSGEPFKCHGNVVSLVRQYGGKQLQGYEIGGFLDSDGWIRRLAFSSHSVWVTPEGVAVDVTKAPSYWSNGPDPENDQVYPFGDISIFIPTHENLWFGDKIPAFPTFGIRGSKSGWVGLPSGEGVPLPSMTSSELHDSENYEEVRKIINRIVPWGYYSEKVMKDKWLNIEHFSNPSLLTGKTWGEIQVR